jgi:predicted nucleic acid-binding protein
MTEFLLDTNCFIQIVRGRPEAPQVQALLRAIPLNQLFITDFSASNVYG